MRVGTCRLRTNRLRYLRSFRRPLCADVVLRARGVDGGEERGEIDGRRVFEYRPFTHDLIGHIFDGFQVEIERVIISDFEDGTYYARLVLKMSNELGTKIVEIDARPSDCIVVALQRKQSIYVS